MGARFLIWSLTDIRSIGRNERESALKNVMPWFMVVILACGLISCMRRMTSVPISNEPLTVGPDWVEIPLVQPLAADWRSQVVRVTVKTKFESNISPLGLRLEGGLLATPEIDAITDGGIHQTFHLASFQNATIVSFENDQIPRGTRFVRLRMRSSTPLVISAVTWISYMPEDTKTGNP